MFRPVRSFVAALLMSTLLLAQATSALAGDGLSTTQLTEQSSSVPLLLDALLLRPVGMLVTGLGTVTFCAIAPIMAITRPTDMGKPFRMLVINPARYTWVDPLGTH
jgi:ABC-type transport system involved in cytochrome c biogenesis permease subunit